MRPADPRESAEDHEVSIDDLHAGEEPADAEVRHLLPRRVCRRHRRAGGIIGVHSCRVYKDDEGENEPDLEKRVLRGRRAEDGLRDGAAPVLVTSRPCVTSENERGLPCRPVRDRPGVPEGYDRSKP